MREIKFRAWDKRLKKIVTDDFLIEPGGTVYQSNRIDPKLILMQYTGLKDKNGKEIYEGDILEDHYWNSMWFTRNVKVEIPDIYTWLCCHKAIKGSYYEVIGNTYENPELLKEI